MGGTLIRLSQGRRINRYNWQLMSEQNPSLNKHRADIDGLRAIAVCSVLLFHFKIFPDYVRGGFIGVDVFFVISGYLISSIIFRDMDRGRYSILEFYDRRVRRIFPALFAMFVACSISALLLYFPSEVRSTGHAIIASSMFVSNILFYQDSGYFDRGSESNPLLHTWSLSVEEQFYVVFPLLVLALGRCTQRQRLVAITTVALASFACAASVVRTDAGAAFYLPHLRAWELLLGSVLALTPVVIRSRTVANLMSSAGLLMLGASFYGITTSSVFPGPSALAPCLATAAVIWAGTAQDNLVTRLLSIRPIQFLGKISYSLYLWHWPVVVFYRLVKEPERLDKLAMIAISIALATISWRFIERPFRANGRWPAARTVSISAACMLLIAMGAAALPTVSRLAWNIPPAATDIIKFAQIDETHMRSGECFFTHAAPRDQETFRQQCLQIQRNKENVLILGDSHAAHLWTGLQERFPDINFLQATAGGCKPIPTGSRADLCRDMLRYVIDEFIPQNRPDVIIISGRWNAGDIGFVSEMAKSLSKYSRVVISGPTVEYSQALPRLLATAIASGRDPAEFAARYRLPEQRQTDADLAAALKSGNIAYFSPYQVICPDACAVWAQTGIPMEFDGSHLTRQGSAFVAQRFPALNHGSQPRS
jgi:peptidoglycan/LPS O-acetylase OafA/YrhL